MLRLESDGIIVAVGTSDTAGITSFTLVRYDQNGDPDSGFGMGGVATTALAVAAVLQDDGRIVVGGTSDAGDGGEFTVARYESDGALDGSFGSGGIATTSFSGPGTPDIIRSLAIRPPDRLPGPMRFIRMPWPSSPPARSGSRGISPRDSTCSRPAFRNCILWKRASCSGT